PAPEAEAPAAPMVAPDFADSLKAALEPEVHQTALEQQASVQAALQFVADELPVSAKPAAPASSAAALAALFAQDKAPEPQPEPEPELVVDEPDFDFDFPLAEEPVLEPEV